jgi:hypothetical protein
MSIRLMSIAAKITTLASGLMLALAISPCAAQVHRSEFFRQQQDRQAARAPGHPGKHAGQWLRRYKDLPPEQQQKALENRRDNCFASFRDSLPSVARNCALPFATCAPCLLRSASRLLSPIVSKASSRSRNATCSTMPPVCRWLPPTMDRTNRRNNELTRQQSCGY